MLLSITVPQNEEGKEVLKSLMNDLGIKENHIHKGPKSYKAVLPKIPTPKQKEIIEKLMKKASSIVSPDDKEATKRNLELHSSGFLFWSSKAKKLFYEHILKDAIVIALKEIYVSVETY